MLLALVASTVPLEVGAAVGKSGHSGFSGASDVRTTQKWGKEATLEKKNNNRIKRGSLIRMVNSVTTGRLRLQRSGLQASNNVALIFIYEVLVLGTPCFGFQTSRFMMELVHEERSTGFRQMKKKEIFSSQLVMRMTSNVWPQIKVEVIAAINLTTGKN